jgi:hypothetical protein
VRAAQRHEPALRRPRPAGRRLGIETGGERSNVGDTKEDEDERRQKAEDEDRKSR